MINKILGGTLLALLIVVTYLIEFDNNVHMQEEHQRQEDRKKRICDSVDNIDNLETISGNINDLAEFGEQCLKEGQ